MPDLLVSDRVCPWWFCFTFDNFLRRRFQDPTKTVSPYIREGFRVLDIGPGMGYFTIPMARLVGPSGKVIAADLQKHMLNAIHRRAVKAGVQDRIIFHLARPDEIGVSGPVDFSLAFWMVHEVPDRKRFLSQIEAALKQGGQLLLAEPKVHVSKSKFADTVRLATEAGFEVIEKPEIFLSNTVLLRKLKDVNT